jgi:hypothetical protein
MLVISIPASHDPERDGESGGSALEVGGPNGQEALQRLQNVVRRVADQWRPASSQESFEIVRRRLFEPLSNVATGCVLVASPDEIDHFSRHAVVLVLSHGAQGSRGVTLEMATAFNVGEMAASLADSPFAALPLFRGGSAGKDQIVMLHDVEDLGGSQPIGCVIRDTKYAFPICAAP